jgi:hypothetical protein
VKKLPEETPLEMNPLISKKRRRYDL